VHHSIFTVVEITSWKDVMINTNVRGLLNVTKALIPGMKERCRGHVINVSARHFDM
jgi:NADP-dependent 3-hydroxy acid dehydrogenase YdfG